MKFSKLFFLAALFAFSMTSCIPENVSPSGNVIERTYNISNFTGLDISHAFNAHVTFGDTEEVVIEADDNLFDHIICEKSGDMLRVGLKPGTNIKGSSTFRLHLTAKQLNELEASGASEVIFDDEVDQTRFQAYLSGASYLDVGLNVAVSTINLRGGSEIDLQGSAKALDLKLTGASTLEDYDFAVDDLVIDSRGASQARISVDKTIDADLSGASKLEYKGDAEIIHQELTGASEIIKQ